LQLERGQWESKRIGEYSYWRFGIFFVMLSEVETSFRFFEGSGRQVSRKNFFAT